jgi:serine/threonine-protein kinase
MADALEISVGMVLGGTYQITGLLGRGGMGAVWTANHLRIPGKRFAVKVLHTSNLSDESYARFRREAEIASRIGHPNIVEVIDWNTLDDGKTPYLVLEYLQGESLAGRLLRGALPLEQAMNLTRQIGSALAAAHRAGIVHRDLKPDNIFLTPTDSGGQLGDHVKILDFGISKIRNSTTLQTQEARLLGTPQYMSPEQAAGKNNEVDERTDVFALGAIVYEMLTGRPAFTGENLAAVVFQVVFGQPTPLEELLPGLPPRVVAAVNRALSKKREERQPDVVTFVAELSGRSMSTLDRSGKTPVASNEAFAATTDQASLPPPGPIAQGTPQMSHAPPAPLSPRELVTAPMKAARPGKARPWLWALAFLAVGGGGAAIAVVAMRNGEQRTIVADAPPAPKDVQPVAPPAESRADAAVAVVTPPPPATPDAGEPPRPKPPRPPPPPQPARVEPDEPDEPEPRIAVIAELVEAEKALARGDYQTAIRLARKGLTLGKTGHAYSIIARAYCGLRDLGNAKAALQNIGGRERIRVYRRCRGMGFPLD